MTPVGIVRGNVTYEYYTTYLYHHNQIICVSIGGPPWEPHVVCNMGGPCLLIRWRGLLISCMWRSIVEFGCSTAVGAPPHLGIARFAQPVGKVHVVVMLFAFFFLASPISAPSLGIIVQRVIVFFSLGNSEFATGVVSFDPAPTPLTPPLEVSLFCVASGQCPSWRDNMRGIVHVGVLCLRVTYSSWESHCALRNLWALSK